MELITYSHVQDLVQQLPPQSLPAAYEMLRSLSNSGEPLRSTADFLRLPLAVRHDILARQADQLEPYYTQTADERSDWQAGDFLDEGAAG